MLGCSVSEGALGNASSEITEDEEVYQRLEEEQRMMRARKLRRHHLSLLDQSFHTDIDILQFDQKSTKIDSQEDADTADMVASIVETVHPILNNPIAPSLFRSSNFKTIMRTAKYLSVLLLVMLFIKVMIIATAIYFMTQMDPKEIKIQKVHLTGLSDACGKLSVQVELPQTFLLSWFRVVAKDVEVSVGLPSAFRGDESDSIVRIKVPEVVVGRGGHLINTNGISIGFETGRSLTRLFDYLRTVDDRPRPIRIDGKARIQTNSLGIPLDFELTRSETVLASDLFDGLDGQKDDAEMERIMKEVKLSALQLVPGKGDKSFAIVGMLEMPRSLFGDFLEIDVPEMSLDLLHSISNSSSFVHFATMKLKETKLTGYLLDFNNQIGVSLEISPTEQEGLLDLIVAARDGNLGEKIKVRIRGSPNAQSAVPSLLQNWLSTFSFTLDLGQLFATFPVDSLLLPDASKDAKMAAVKQHGAKFLFKRNFSGPDGVLERVGKMGRDHLKAWLGDAKSRIEKYCRKNPNPQVIRLGLEKIHYLKKMPTADLKLTISRAFLSQILNFNLGSIEGRIPKVSARLGVEKMMTRKLEAIDLGLIRINQTYAKRGNSNFEFTISIAATNEKMFWKFVKAAMSYGSIRALAPMRFYLTGRKGTNFLTEILRILQMEIGVSRKGALAIRLRRARSSAKLLPPALKYSLKLEQSAKSAMRVEEFELPMAQHKASLAISSNSNNLMVNLGFSFSPKTYLKEWPSLQVYWPEDIEIRAAPVFKSGAISKKLDKAFDLMRLGIPAGSVSVSMAPTRYIACLFHSGEIQLQLSLNELRRKQEKRLKRFGRIGIVRLIKLYVMDYMKDMKGGSLQLTMRQGKRKLKTVLGLPSLGSPRLPKAPAHQPKWLEAFGFQIQLSLAGLLDSRILVQLGVPDLPRIILPKAMQSAMFAVEIVLPHFWADLCVQSNGDRHCPLRAGVPASRIVIGAQHSRRIRFLSAFRSSDGHDKLLNEMPPHASHLKQSNGLVCYGRVTRFSEVSNVVSLISKSDSSFINRDLTIGFGNGSAPSGRLLDKIIEEIGQHVKISLPRTSPSSVSLPKTQALKKVARNSAIKVLFRLDSNNNRQMKGLFGLHLPRRSFHLDRNSESTAADGRLLRMKWSPVKISLASGPFHSLVKISGGALDLGFRDGGSVSFDNELVKISFDFTVKDGHDLLSSEIKLFIDKLLLNIDSGIGALVSTRSLKRCKFSKPCRKSLSSKNSLLAFRDISNLEFAYKTEYKGRPESGWAVQRLDPFLALAKVVWRVVSRQQQRKVSIKTSQERLPFNLELGLIKHKDNQGVPIVKMPCLLPRFCPKGVTLGVATSQHVLGIEAKFYGLFPLLHGAISKNLGYGLSLLNLPVHPGRFVYMIKLPSLQLATGMNGIDLAVIKVDPLRLSHSVPLQYCRHQLIQEESTPHIFRAWVDFPKHLEEFPRLLMPFSLDAFFQIAVDPVPSIRLSNQLVKFSNSPLTSTLSTTRLGTGSGDSPSLLSILLAGLARDLPIFSIVNEIEEPFHYGTTLLETRKDSMVAELRGLRMLLPVPEGIKVNLGDVKVIVNFEGFPFAKLEFPKQVLHPGSNPMVGQLTFSPTAFGIDRDELEVAKALSRMISLSVADSLPLTFLIQVGDGVVLQTPFLLPKRPVPGMEEILELSQGMKSMMGDSKEVAELISDGIQVAKDIGKEYLNDWTTYAKSKMTDFLDWVTGVQRQQPDDFDDDFEEENEFLEDDYNDDDDDADEEGGKYVRLRVPNPFPWETQILAYDVKFGFDKTAGLSAWFLGHLLGRTPVVKIRKVAFPRDAPIVSLEKGRDQGKRQLKRFLRRAAFDPILRVAPGEPLTLQKSLLKPSLDKSLLKFGIQLADSMYNGPGVCAAMSSRLVLKLHMEGGDPFVLDMKIKLEKLGIPRAIGCDPCNQLMECLPKVQDPLKGNELMVAVLVQGKENEEEAVEQLELNPLYMTSMVSSPAFSAALTLKHVIDTRIPRKLNFILWFDPAALGSLGTTSIIQRFTRAQFTYTFSLELIFNGSSGFIFQPHIGAAQMMAGHNEVWRMDGGAFPQNAPEGWYCFSLFFRRDSTTVVIESVLDKYKAIFKTSFAAPSFNLNDDPVSLAFVAKSNLNLVTKIKGITIQSILADLSRSRIFYTSTATKPFERCRFAVQLFDSCGNPLGGQHVNGLRVRLMRVDENGLSQKWQPLPSTYQFTQASYRSYFDPSHFEQSIDGHGSEAFLDPLVAYHQESQLYLVEAYPSLPGRYRIFLANDEDSTGKTLLKDSLLPSFSGSSCWVLVERNHIYIASV